MSDEEILACAEALAGARRSGRTIADLPFEPGSVAEAHEIQDRVTALLGETAGAFKVNAPANGDVVRGVIFGSLVHPSGARVSKKIAPLLAVEGEIAFLLREDLPARPQLYTREDIAAAAVPLPAIEVVSTRFDVFKGPSSLAQLADCISNAALVCGAPVEDWTGVDVARLSVTLRVDGEVEVSAEGPPRVGDPLDIAVALANLMRLTDGLKAGQIITTGSWTGVKFLQPGNHVSVAFENFGSVELICEE